MSKFAVNPLVSISRYPILVLHVGAGAYICGEETALLDSLEGFRGQPRLEGIYSDA